VLWTDNAEDEDTADRGWRLFEAASTGCTGKDEQEEEEKEDGKEEEKEGGATEEVIEGGGSMFLVELDWWS
jgi:hypothetical protein